MEHGFGLTCWSDYALRCALAKLQGDAKRGPKPRGMHAEIGKQKTHAAVVFEMPIAERKLYNLTSLKHSWEPRPVGILGPLFFFLVHEDQTIIASSADVCLLGPAGFSDIVSLRITRITAFRSPGTVAMLY